MNTSHIRTVSMLCVLALATSMVGCQSIAEKAAETALEKSTGVEVDTEGENVTITGEDGTEITASSKGELPEGFPSDVPVYEGNIVSSIKAENAWSVTIETPDDLDTVFDWYKTELKSAGWKIATEAKMADGAALVSQKGNQNLQVTLGASDSDGAKTAVAVYTSTQ